jgi:LDH2 family malate/lactate/ureidoglycolate dehydrogenase
MGEEKNVQHEDLRNLCTRIQKGFGVPGKDAGTVSDCLVEANLMGIDTHGVIRLKFYMDRIKAGGNNPKPNIRTIRESPTTALLDADNALGPVGGKRAMDLAVEKASNADVGVVLIRKCNHYGPAGYYTRMAAAKDMIGMSFSNVLASMPPTGGAEKRVGNNPYAFGFPAGDEPPVVVDGATSKASWGKLFLCAQTGQNLPEGCYIDKDGNETVDPQEVMAGGALLPFAGHKGYGLAVAIELLTGMLADAELDHDIPHPYKKSADSGANTFFMVAVRIDAFQDVSRFKTRMDEWIRLMRDTRKAAGTERIWLPGEMEAVKRKQRVADGIPLNAKMIDELRELADEVGAAFEL